jgi:hypothetical protein
MPITFTNGLTPDFSPNSFNTEREHVKRIFALLDNETAFVNILTTPLSNLIVRIDELTLQLETDANVATAELGDITTTDTLLFFGDNIANLPDGWINASPPRTIIEMTEITDKITDYITANELIRTNLAILKSFLTTADDTFKLHNDLLSGIREDPPPGNVKPTLRGLMGLVTALNTLENKFGITFTNYLVKVFGTLFTGDVTINNAQTFLNTNPIPTTYASLGVLEGVQVDPYLDDPTDTATSINNLLSGSTYASTILTHRDNFQTHITNDTNEYNIVLDKLDRLVQSLGISGHIGDDYYKFMYTDVFGSTPLKQIISDKDNGVID